MTRVVIETERFGKICRGSVTSCSHRSGCSVREDRHMDILMVQTCNDVGTGTGDLMTGSKNIPARTDQSLLGTQLDV